MVCAKLWTKNKRRTRAPRSRLGRFLELCLIVLGVVFVREARGDAPVGRYVVGPETVYDNRTQLTWQRKVSFTKYTQAQAIDRCANLSLAGQGWRLPSVMELVSLVDDTRVGPAFDPTAFPNDVFDYTWTSTPYAETSVNAWVVYFYNGTTFSVETTGAWYVRCVR